MDLKLILSAVIIALFSLSATSQHRCGTVDDDAFMENLRNNKKHLEETWSKKIVDRFVPIEFHNVATTQGEGRIPESLIYEAVCLLNERYDETEMRFYVAGINNINNTNIYESPGSAQAVSVMRSDRNNNALNVFIVDYAGPGIGGYYSGGNNNDFVVMLQTAIADDRYTLEHELGHFFTLPHTHRGWDQTSDNPDERGGYDRAIHGDTVTITSVSSSQSGVVTIELVDGSNCTTAADEICDTPPDYGFGYACSCCTMVYNVWDRNNDKIEPMIDNVMSYSEGCGTYRFSDEQTMNMFTSYDSNRRSYLRGGSVDSYTPITEIATILAPLANVDEFDGVLFDWEDVPNADSYRLKIDGDATIDMVVNESEIFITSLVPGGFYFWSVEPFNIFGSSCGTPDVRSFSTGTGTTGLSEIDGVSKFTINPNPASTNDVVSINFQSEVRMDAEINVIALSGQSVVNQSYDVLKGVNKIKIPRSEGLTPGIYIIELISQRGRITDKLIIE